MTNLAADSTKKRALSLVDAAPPPSPTPEAEELPWQRRTRWAFMVVAALPRAWAAIWDHGVFWPDEIHQTLEQAHRLAFGYGLIPWEFRQAARSWLFPGLLGIYWKGISLLGIRHSFGLVVSAKLLMAAASLLTIDIGRRLAQRLGGPLAGLVAVILMASCPLLVCFGSRAMTETASAPLIVAAAYLSLVAARQRPALAGSLASLTIFLRYQNGLLALGLLVILAWRRQWPAAVRYALAATLVGIAGGLLDWATWQYPFEAFWVYLKFNLIDGKAAEAFGSSSFGYYGKYLEASMGASLGVILLGLALAYRRARGLVALLGCYFLAHSLVAHKELRFLVPVVPLALALAAVGLTDLLQEGWPSTRRFAAASAGAPPEPKSGWAASKASLVVASVLAVAMAERSRTVSIGELGRLGGGDVPVWHVGEDYFEAMWDAESRPDVCGVALVGNGACFTGGYTYFHRHVPMYFDLDHLANINYVVGGKEEKLPDGWTQLSTHGQYALYHREETCAVDWDYAVPSCSVGP